MKAVILDSYALQPGDLNWAPLYALVDEVVEYPRTQYSQLVQRIGTAELAVVNKCGIDAAVLRSCPNLRWIGVTATGTDSLDVAACCRAGVTVSNVPAYSTHSVAQLTFALLLELVQSPARHEAALRAGYWQLDVPKEYGIMPMHELYGKTIGIIGYGAIGRQVAKIALAFGMRVLVHTRTVRKKDAKDGVQFVSLEMLLAGSDVVSLHCPCTQETENIINADTLAQMRSGALLLNTARGALVAEPALAAALATGKLGGYGADVLRREPADVNSPLLCVPNAVFTPHIAWTTQEALARLAQAVCENAAAFLRGDAQNVIHK